MQTPASLAAATADAAAHFPSPAASEPADPVGLLGETAEPLDFEAELAAGTDERYYDADLYDLEYGRRRHDIDWYRKLARDVAEAAAGREEPLRIVDLGCGSGRLLVPLLRDGHWVCGIDRSAPMLRACQKRLSSVNARARTRVHILQSDFRALPLAGPFRLILCPFNAFMHLYTRDDVERFLAEVAERADAGLVVAPSESPDFQQVDLRKRRYGAGPISDPGPRLSLARLIDRLRGGADPTYHLFGSSLHLSGLPNS